MNLIVAVLLVVGIVSIGAIGPAPAQAVLNNLVINEFDYDQAGTDAAEIVEIKNISGSSVSLDGWTLELVNGTGGSATVYDTIALPALDLAAVDYFVVATSTCTTRKTRSMR